LFDSFDFPERVSSQMLFRRFAHFAGEDKKILDVPKKAVSL